MLRSPRWTTVYRAATPRTDISHLAARPFTVDGIDFLSAPLGGFDVDALVVVKPLDEVDRCRRLFDSRSFSRIVELGVAYGGSVALVSLLSRPSNIVAFELSPTRVSVLDRFLEAQGLTEAVTVHYGVDQADRERVRELVLQDVGPDLDLVIDDASHRYDETVATFEALFPLLAPGGVYIIEDWNSDHHIRAMLAGALDQPGTPAGDWATNVLSGARGEHDQKQQTDVAASSLLRAGERPAITPLSKLPLELVLTLAERTPGIDELSVNPFWVAITRSDEPIPKESFQLGSLVTDVFQHLAVG